MPLHLPVMSYMHLWASDTWGVHLGEYQEWGHCCWKWWGSLDRGILP